LKFEYVAASYWTCIRIPYSRLFAGYSMMYSELASWLAGCQHGRPLPTAWRKRRPPRVAVPRAHPWWPFERKRGILYPYPYYRTCDYN